MTNPMMPQMPANQPQGAMPVHQPSATDPTTAGAAVSSNAPAQYTSKTTISSLADLKRKAPKVYNLMMLGIAQNICIQINRDQEHLKEAWKKLRE